MIIRIKLEDGDSYEYDQIEVVQAVANNTDDQMSKAGGSSSIIPDHVDVTNYKELAEYYNFGNAEHVKVRE